MRRVSRGRLALRRDRDFAGNVRYIAGRLWQVFGEIRQRYRILLSIALRWIVIAIAFHLAGT